MTMTEIITTLGEWLNELVESAQHASPQAMTGVGLIFFYFLLILCVSAWRIRRGEHLEHHH